MRYESQPALLDAAHYAFGFICSWEKHQGIQEPTIVRRAIEEGLNRFYGTAS